MNKVKIISQKTVFKSKLFEIKETKIRTQDGNFHLHDDVFRKPSVYVFPITNTYELYLISEYRYLQNRRILEAVAGFINHGETSVQAAKRELKEEAGITANQLEEISRIEIAASVIKSTVHLFLARDFELGEQKLDTDEDITVVKMPLDEAVRKVISGEINLAVGMTGILMLDKLRREKKL